MVAKIKRPSSANKKKLAAENARLQAENKQLKQKVTKSKTNSSFNKWLSKSWRAFAIVILAALAGGLLVAGNVLFWAGHTVVDSQSYKRTVTTLIKDPKVQSATALYTTNQIFDNNDVPAAIASVLPPRADFLAVPLSGQLKTLTQRTINKTLANDKFQSVWVNVNVKAHDDLLKVANSPAGQDGVININELYQKLSANLADTKLSFLADKKLPPKVGNIAVIKSNKLHTLHVISSNISNFKYISLSLVLAFSALAVWVSRSRRQLVIGLSALYAVLMAISLITFRLVSSIVTSKVQPDYQAGINSAASIVLHPLVLQTWTVLLLALLVAIGAWLGGPYHSAKALRTRIQMLLAGKAHKALFNHENKVTTIVGGRKRSIQVTSISLIALAMLLSKLSPKAVILYALAMLIVVSLVELVAAPKTSVKK